MSQPAQLRSLYRSLLRELPPRPFSSAHSRSPLHQKLRQSFSNDAPHQSPLVHADQLLQYLKAQRQYTTLLERYNPGMNMDEEERVRLSARRVGMDLPKEYGRNQTYFLLDSLLSFEVRPKFFSFAPVAYIDNVGLEAVKSTALSSILKTQTMFSSLTNLINNIALGPQNREVKKYLDEATCDSVSADLGKVLSPELRSFEERDLLQKTFDKYCFEDSSRQKYWTEESFRKHIRSTHTASAISDAAIQLLWRSFHFYAYHPFPRHLQDTKVDWEAFRRAALLNVFQCDGFLGTRELDWFWRNDATFFRKASFARIFRSIAVPEDMTWAESLKKQSDITPTLSDAMDALVMVGPQFMHAIPSEAQLEKVAQKLLSEGPVVARRPVKRGELSILMSLLLRLRLQKEKWGSSYHLGDVVEASPADDGLTEALVNSLAEHENETTMDPGRLLRAVDLMPNLLLRFQQLWAVLFQPSGVAVEKPSSAPEITPASIRGALSLFAPPIRVPKSYHERISLDTRMTLREVRAPPDSHDMTISRLTRDLSRHSSGYVVLFTTEAAEMAPKTVVGAYFPSPSQMGNSYDKPDPLSNPLHVLFELEPKFNLLRWAKAKVSPSDLIKTEDGVSIREIEMDGCPDLSSAPYVFGDPTSDGTSLRVNPEDKTVTLTNDGGQFYTDMRTAGGAKDSEFTTLKNPRMDVFRVAGAIDRKR
ncbi:hypothetical protein F4861DRAFT_536712 [Xylaria intraflava]|nr:hypothetical protein F4861DRAFT_536712 [Xylaria intraflava]